MCKQSNKIAWVQQNVKVVQKTCVHTAKYISCSFLAITDILKPDLYSGPGLCVNIWLSSSSVGTSPLTWLGTRFYLKDCTVANARTWPPPENKRKKWNWWFSRMVNTLLLDIFLLCFWVFCCTVSVNYNKIYKNHYVQYQYWLRWVYWVLLKVKVQQHRETTLILWYGSIFVL